jgi:hypothetical protein
MIMHIWKASLVLVEIRQVVVTQILQVVVTQTQALEKWWGIQSHIYWKQYKVFNIKKHNHGSMLSKVLRVP